MAKKPKKNQNIKWYIAAFYNGARQSINANKHSWLSLDIAQFCCLAHANVSDCEYTSGCV